VNGKSQNFVNDQIARFKQYGTSMQLSEKQWAWLRDLNRKITGINKQDEPGFGQTDERWRDKL
jgi:hypothetical protein